MKELKKVLISYNEQAVASVGGEIDMFGNGGVKTKEQILEEIIKGVKDYEQRNRTKQSDNVSVSSKDKSDNGGESESNQRTSQAESDRGDKQEEVKPIGKGIFGNIYDQFKGKVKEAVDFLLKHKEGDLLGVFHRDEIGDIDLIWGNTENNQGLAHIIDKHIIDKHINRQHDFSNIDEAITIIEDVINNGEMRPIKNNSEKVTFTKDGYRVSVKRKVRDNQGNVIGEKNWVVTAFDTEKTQKQKESETSSEKTLTTPPFNREADGVTLPSNDVSDSAGKVTTNSLYAEESSKKNVGEPKELVNRIRISNCHVGGRVLFGDKGGTFLGSIDIRNKISELLKSEGAELNDGKWHIFNTQSPTGKPVTVIFHNSTIKQLGEGARGADYAVAVECWRKVSEEEAKHIATYLNSIGYSKFRNYNDSQSEQLAKDIDKILHTDFSNSESGKEKAENFHRATETEAITEQEAEIRDALVDLLGEAIGKENVITDSEEAQMIIDEQNGIVRPERVAEESKERAERVKNDLDLRRELKEITGAEGYGTNTAYVRGTSQDGTTYEVRVGNHIANFENFDRNNEELPQKIVSVVVMDEKFDKKNARYKSSEEINRELEEKNIDSEFQQIIIDDVKNKSQEEIQQAIEDVLFGMQVLKERGRLLFDSESAISYSKVQKNILETVSISNNKKHQQTVVSSNDGAKILRNLDTLVKKIENLEQSPIKTFIGEVAKAIGAKRYGLNSSYIKGKAKNGTTYEIRVGNHIANFDNFDKNNEELPQKVVSIVVIDEKFDKNL